MQTPDAGALTVDAFLTSSALSGRLPLVLTADMQRFIDSFALWLQRETQEAPAASSKQPQKKEEAKKEKEKADEKQAKEAAPATAKASGAGGLGFGSGAGLVPFLIVGPDGCGKTCLLEHCFAQLRSTNVATVHCSAQTTPVHVLQKLKQVRSCALRSIRCFS